MKVCFIGLGYIGLPTAVVSASRGLTVIGVDIDEEIVNTVNQGKIHIVEPGLGELTKSVVESGNLTASLKPELSDVYLVVVPTPFKGNHEPDISYVEAATVSIIDLLKEGDTYIIESTSPIGTTERMAELIFSLRPELHNKINIAYCPERVLPGNVIFELENNDRVIGGIDEKSTDAAIEFYTKFVRGKLHRTNARTAEMVKLTENSSRDVQIAFANELSIICNSAGINVWELIELANKHPRVNILWPGCGVGGHCIAVDPYFITSHFPEESKIIAKAREINNYKPLWCVEQTKNAMLKFELENGRKPSIALMGLAFKPNIDDLRESPAKYIVELLLQELNDRDVYIAEPNISNHIRFKLTSYEEAYKNADIVVFLVAHKEFKAIKQAKDKVLLDFCGILKN
ncbi:UDP-N-acetyl-D-mannosamine dehydrogenase [Draconibacterium sediminis]|uniref:UDP-N-acetyl-D-mannosamine dehydrogenase n=1 Tax=Draconibacterium sediminis TaxID=1544798 RepID=UPI0026F12A7E|nr:UDP-N-acetyl-D-mannosamine dehydrogenase [Draconibacterium sediminis]